MKKILLIAIAAIVFVSCKKSSNSTSTNSAIVGKWYVTTDSTAEYDNGSLVDHSTVTLNHTSYALFNANGSGSSIAYDGSVIDTIKFTYTVSGKTLTLNYPNQVVEGTTVTGYSEQGTINVLTDTKLETAITYTQSGGGETFKYFELTDFTK